MFDADLCLTWKDSLDVLSVSDRVEGLLGFKIAEPHSPIVSLQQLIHPADLPAVRELFSRLGLTGETRIRIRGADGRIRCLAFLYFVDDANRDSIRLKLRVADRSRTASADTQRCAAEMLTMLNHLDQCACVVDRDHKMQAANANFCALFSREESALVGLTDYDLFPEDYADKSYEAVRAVLAGQPVARFSLEAAHKGEKGRTYEVRTLPVHAGGGQAEWVCSVVADTTALTRGTQRLRAAEESLREVRQRARVGDFVVDVKAETWTASEVLYEILGLEKDCPRTGAVWIDLIVPEDFARLGTVYGEVVLGQSATLDCEIRFIRPSDKVARWGHVRAELGRDAQNRPAELHGTIEDITERKAAEELERKHSGLLEIFIHDAPTGLAMFDRELRYITASQRWIEDRGLHQWNITNRSVYDLHPDHPEAWKEDHRRALAGETSPFRDDRYVDRTGAARWVRRMVRPWREGDGSIGGIVVLSEDITERKEAERALRESEESLREAQRIAGVGSYVFEIDRDRWVSSEVLDDIFGIDSAHDRTLNGWTALVHPEDRTMMASYVVNEVVGRGVPFNKEYRIIRPCDGGTRWVLGKGRMETDAEGRPCVLRGTIQDITEQKQANASLRESRHQLQLFIEHAPAAIAMFDREMRYMAVSRRWIESYGLPDTALLGRSHYETFPDLPERWKEAHRRGMAGEGVRMEQEVFERANGRKIWIRWELLPWYKSDDSVGGIVLFTEDISAIRESAERLLLAANVFTHTSESIVITDAAGEILDVNQAFTRLYGYSREEVLGKNPRLLNSGRQPREFYAELWAQLQEKGQWSGEIWNRGKSGQILPGMLTISAVPDEAGRPKQYVGLFSDLSPVKEREQQLKHVAHFDPVTGLPNRTLLGDRLRQAMAHARRAGRLLAIAYLDFDDFTALNERHGRVACDQAMNVVIRRMMSALREADTLARLGGDEFAAVLVDVADVDRGLHAIGRLRDAVSEPVSIGDLSVRMSASIGVSFYPQADEVEPDQLVRQADQAMYFAKLAGKARFHVFDPMLDRSMRGRHEDLQRIRQALKEEEFELHFQPKVNMRTGTILGAEALIRWRHPELGLLLPEHFLPVMEGNMLVVELGDWVIAHALAQLERWREHGLDIPVSVNVDAMQLQEPKFVERLRELLGRHPAIQPSKLELEVLESSAFQDIAQVSEVIRACSKLGVSFALDDFGTGYSSLSYLKRLPVDVLKIDRSFVHDMLDDPEDLTILEGVLVLASAFRRQAIAEGVETVDHGLMLLRLGCQIGQGYQIARAMPASDLPAWAAAWRPDPRWMDVAEIDPAQWPILHAGVEHRAWALEFEDFVLDRRPAAPAMDRHLCRLGSWLDSERTAGRGDGTAIQSIDELHQRLHIHADGILHSKMHNGATSAADRLVELHAIKDNLVETLQQYVQRL